MKTQHRRSHRHRHTVTETDVVPDTETHTHRQKHRHRHGHGHGHRHRHRHRHGHRHGHRKTHTDTQMHTDTRRHTDTQANTDTHTHTHTETDTDTDTGADSHTHQQTQAQIHSHKEAQTQRTRVAIHVCLGAHTYIHWAGFAAPKAAESSLSLLAVDSLLCWFICLFFEPSPSPCKLTTLDCSCSTKVFTPNQCKDLGPIIQRYSIFLVSSGELRSESVRNEYCFSKLQPIFESPSTGVWGYQSKRLNNSSVVRRWSSWPSLATAARSPRSRRCAACTRNSLTTRVVLSEVCRHVWPPPRPR